MTRCRGIVSPLRASACPGEMIPPAPLLIQGKMRCIGSYTERKAGLRCTTCREGSFHHRSHSVRRWETIPWHSASEQSCVGEKHTRSVSCMCGTAFLRVNVPGTNTSLTDLTMNKRKTRGRLYISSAQQCSSAVLPSLHQQS